MSELTIPDRNITLVDGSIVMLKRFPGTKWIVHEGWYTYNNEKFLGWYFSSIPAQTNIPVNDIDLESLIVVSDSGYPPVVPYPPIPYPPSPDPKPDRPIPFTESMLAQLQAAFITVADNEAREAIDTTAIPDGKLVYVANDDAFYRWVADTQEWISTL